MKKIKGLFEAPLANGEKEKERAIKKDEAQGERVDTLVESFYKERDFYKLQKQMSRKRP